jgi:1,2-phenylacetyl-CoA epoxidase catalytic subunit
MKTNEEYLDELLDKLRRLKLQSPSPDIEDQISDKEYEQYLLEQIAEFQYYQNESTRN